MLLVIFTVFVFTLTWKYYSFWFIYTVGFFVKYFSFKGKWFIYWINDNNGYFLSTCIIWHSSECYQELLVLLKETIIFFGQSFSLFLHGVQIWLGLFQSYRKANSRRSWVCTCEAEVRRVCRACAHHLCCSWAPPSVSSAVCALLDPVSSLLLYRL